MDELELRKVGKWEVWFRKESSTKSHNQKIELERIIKILTDEDFIGSDKNRRLQNPDNFEIIERFPNHMIQYDENDENNEKYTCLCTEDTCSYLMIINHLLTDIKFAVGSRCYLRFDENKSKEIYHKIQSIKCIECKCPLVYKINEYYNVNTNQKCNNLCYSCDKRCKNLQGKNAIIDVIILKELKIIENLVKREINKLKKEEDKINQEKSQIKEQKRKYENEKNKEEQKVKERKKQIERHYEELQQKIRERELLKIQVKQNKNYNDILLFNKKNSDSDVKQINNDYINKKKEDRIYLKISYDEKDDAKKLGAWWDSEKKLWYAPNKSYHKLIKKYKKIDIN